MEPNNAKPRGSGSKRPERVRAVLIHGYKASAGVNSVDRCRPILEAAGVDCSEFDYTIMNGPISGLIGARLLNQNRATRLILECDQLPAADRRFCIAHSNGCAIALRAMRTRPRLFHRWLFVNPALRHDVTFPPGVSATIYYTPGEWPTRVAELLPDSLQGLWGDMGATGYVGAPHAGIVNCNTGSVEWTPFFSRSHSDKFDPLLVEHWTHEWLRDAMEPDSAISGRKL